MKLGAVHGGLRSGKRSAGWPVGSVFNMTLQGNRESTARGGLMLIRGGLPQAEAGSSDPRRRHKKAHLTAATPKALSGCTASRSIARSMTVSTSHVLARSSMTAADRLDERRNISTEYLPVATWYTKHVQQRPARCSLQRTAGIQRTPANGGELKDSTKCDTRNEIEKDSFSFHTTD